MNRTRRARTPVLWTLAALALAASAVAAWVQSGREGALPALPEQATPAWSLVYAREFRLEEAYVHWWRAERPEVRSGYLLVLEADPELLVRRQSLESVLYVGRQTAERVNSGDESGNLVALVPSAVGADGRLELDLTQAPIWFGSPELPERVDAARVELEYARALEQHITAPPPDRVRSALERGGPPLALADRVALQRAAAEVVRTFSPTEVDLARSLSAPRLK